MLFKKVIYVEEKILNTPIVNQIINKLKTEKVIVINHYKDVLNQTNADWRFEKSIQKIILAHKEDNFYYKGSYLTPHFGFDEFYYNTLAINCLYDCSYCYLQGMFNSPHIVLFVNNSDFIEACKQLLINKANKKIYFALSYDTDLAALEALYPYCKEWMNFAANHPNLTIEIRTKSSQTIHFENYPKIENAIFAWSLLPDEIIKKFEPLTPNLNQRIKAINKAIIDNRKVMLCIDPLIYIPQFEKIYSDFMDELNQKIDLNAIHLISIGAFRMNEKFYGNIKKSNENNELYQYRYQVYDGVITYRKNESEKLINVITQKLNDFNFKKYVVYD